MTTENTHALRAVLSPYYTADGKIVEEALDTAEYFVSMFMVWDDIINLVDSGTDEDKKQLWWVHYIMLGSLSGTAITDKDFPQHKKTIIRVVEDKVGRDKADAFESMIDSILFGHLRTTNKFYKDNEVMILNSVLDDAFNNAAKQVYVESNPEISTACDICKWKFLYKISLICAGPLEAHKLNVRLLGMRTA